MGIMGSLGDPFGTEAAKAANKANEKRYKEALKLLGKPGSTDAKSLFGLLAQTYGQAEQASKEQIDVLDAAFGRAEGIAGTLGADASRQIMDRERRQLGASQAGLAQRGLYNSTVGANLARGIGAQTDRSLTQVSESVAGLRSSLATQGGTARAAALERLSQLYRQRSGAEQNLGLARTGTITSRQDVAAPGWLTQAAPAIGGIFGGGGGLGLGLSSLFGGGSSSSGTQQGNTSFWQQPASTSADLSEIWKAL